MERKIKVDLASKLNSDGAVLIELGCGKKEKANRITIDRVDMPNVDIVADIEEGLDFLPDRSVDEIHCRSVLEHIENFEGLMREMVRVLKDEGKAYIYVPHFSNPYHYSDYTHRRFFGLYSFYYFVDPAMQLKRKVPDFYSDIKIEIESIKLVFRSPFWISKQIRKFWQMIFNISRSFREFYELHMCYRIPCDGIELVFKPVRKVKPGDK